MPVIISPTVQSRWKDCFASSPRVRLTLRTNGEEETKVLTPQNAMVKAGFVAPTVAPTGTIAGAGINGYVVYRYVYASSRYPFVDNAVTGGGEVWPRSSPSPASAVIHPVNDTVTLTVTKTTRSDVDWIWIYRTAIKTTSAEAATDGDAGQMFYIGRVVNDGIAGTTTYADSSATDTTELLELDNYPAPTTQFCIFDGVASWYAIGNFSFDYEVTLNSTSSIVLTGFTAWFSGRDGQTATFDGITTGGYDGRGSFYWKWVSATTAALYSDADLTSLIVVPFNGTTKIHIKGNASTLYRSKPLNPFSWGETDDTFVTEGNVTSVIRDPHLFVVKFGAGETTAMSLVGDDSYLVLSFEQPVGMIRLALDQADTDAFALTAKDIDTTSSIASHFSQVLARSGGNTLLAGVDVSNFDIVSTGGDNASTISDMVFATMRALYPDPAACRLFHSVYDSKTELTAFWIKTKTLGSNLIDTCLLLHAPTGRWSIMPDQQVSESASIFDPETKSSFTMLGTENGAICTGFDTSTFTNILGAAAWTRGTITQSGNNLTMPNVFSAPLSVENTSGTIWNIVHTGEKLPVGATVNFSIGGVIVASLAVLSAAAGASFTVNTAVNIALALYSLDASTANGLWMYVVPSSQTEAHYWVRLAAGVSTFALNTWTPTYIYDELAVSGFSTLTEAGAAFLEPIATEGDIELTTEDLITLTVEGEILSNATGFIGCIPCRHRRYFDLDEPTKAKNLVEAWATMANVGTHYARVFQEFDSAFIANYRFQLLQTKRSDGTASIAWETKTSVPAALQLSFGFEILECGFNQYKNFNYVLQFRGL